MGGERRYLPVTEAYVRSHLDAAGSERHDTFNLGDFLSHGCRLSPCGTHVVGIAWEERRVHVQVCPGTEKGRTWLR